MTADEIRKIAIQSDYRAEKIQTACAIDDCAELLREIAAQLAELNANLKSVPEPGLPVGMW